MSREDNPAKNIFYILIIMLIIFVKFDENLTKTIEEVQVTNVAILLDAIW